MTRRRRLLRLNDAGELELDATGVSHRLMSALGGKEDRLGDTQTSLPDNQAVYMGDQPGTAEKPATQQIAASPQSAGVSPEQNAGAFDRRPMNERITSLNERLNQGSQNAGETEGAVAAMRQVPPPSEDVPQAAPPSVAQAAQSVPSVKGPQEPRGNHWLRRAQEEEPHSTMGRWTPEAARESKRIERMRRERDAAVSSREDVAGIGGIIAAAFRAPQSSLDRAAGAGQRLADQMDGRIDERQDALNAERTARYSSDPSNPVNVNATEAAAAARRQRLAEIELHTQGSAASAQAAREAADARAREDRASREREGQANRDSAMERARLRRGGGGGGGGRVDRSATGLEAPSLEQLPASEAELSMAREVLTQRNPAEGYNPNLDLGDVINPQTALQEQVVRNRMAGVTAIARGETNREAAAGVRADAPLTNQQENQSRQNYVRQAGGLISMRQGLAEAEAAVNSMNDRDLALASEALNRANGNVQQAMTQLASNPNAGMAVNTLQNLSSLIALSRSGKAVSDRERQMLVQSLGAGQFVSVSALREGLARVRRAADEDYRFVNQGFSSVVDAEGNYIGQEPAPAEAAGAAAVNPAHVQALVQEAQRRGRPLTPEQAEEMIRRRAGR